MELRQLRYFLTLAEELHFGRAAAREHIVQSALSQQIQRLERELGVPVVERNTHHVRLTRAGNVLVTEARAVLRSVEQAFAATRQASAGLAVIRVAVGDPSLDTMPQILRNVQYNQPDIVVHRSEAPVPSQYRMLAECSLDIGIGRASHAPAGVATEVVRLDQLGVLAAENHPSAGADAFAIADLAHVPLVLAETSRAPEFNEFVTEMCTSAGFPPMRYRGSVQSIRAAAEVVSVSGCLAPVTRSCDLLFHGIRWIPLEPACYYPWSLLWRADDPSPGVAAVLRSARALARKLGWLTEGHPAGHTAPSARPRGHPAITPIHDVAERYERPRRVLTRHDERRS